MKNILFFILLAILSACRSEATETGIEKKFSVNGTTLNYTIQGHGPPLYLLHGGMESRDSFANQIPEFSKSFTVVALDSREQGRSSRADAQITYDLMSRDVVSLARHLGHDKISIMGSSDGGITGLTTAISQVDLVENLIVLGTNYHFEAYPKTTRDFITDYEWNGDTNPEAYPGIFIRHYMTGQDNLSEFGGLLKEMSQMWTTSPTFTIADMESVKARVLIINGDHEDMDLNHVLSLYEALPNASLFVVPDGTHYAMEEKPELINFVVLDFLKSPAGQE